MLDNLFMPRDAESRSLSAENFRGDKGGGAKATFETTLHKASAEAARDLGPGWKVSPCLSIPAGGSATIMDNDGPGVIRHMWMTLEERFFRDVVVRIYWDGQASPSVECPIGDFFCAGWCKALPVAAVPINVNSQRALNCYFAMPFRRHARIVVHNESPNHLEHFFYTVNYTLERVPEESLSFHAQWRRSNPLAYMTDHVILDGVHGRGQYVGTYLAWQTNAKGWWGEGEVKMFIDGDALHPTICGTGTEDYFGGAWNFGDGGYSCPFLGYRLISGTAGESGARMSMYRFHVPDPIFFRRDLRITVQALGWRSERRYLPLQDDIASVAYWYQSLPHQPFNPLPIRDSREVT
jgi:hypothetical protein